MQSTGSDITSNLEVVQTVVSFQRSSFNLDTDIVLEIHLFIDIISSTISDCIKCVHTCGTIQSFSYRISTGYPNKNLTLIAPPFLGLY